MLFPAHDDATGSFDDGHRSRNYNICDAIDLTKIGIVIEEMVGAGMDKNMAAIFKAHADSLQAAMRSENNRLKLEKLNQT